MDRMRKLRGIRKLLEREEGSHRYCSLDDVLGKDRQVPQAPAPTPVSQTIAAQAAATPSVYTPDGQAVYSGDPNVAGSYRLDVADSPAQAAIRGGRQSVAQALLGRTGVNLNSSPAVYKFNGATDPTTNKFFQAQKALLDPVWDKEQERLDQRLANQGLPSGSEGNESAADYDRNQFALSRGKAYEQASADALTSGFNQDIATRQQNLNEVAQALGGSQLTPVNAGPSQVDPNAAFANYNAGVNRAYQGQLAGYNADVASTNNLIGGGATVAAAFI